VNSDINYLNVGFAVGEVLEVAQLHTLFKITCWVVQEKTNRSHKLTLILILVFF